MDDEWDLHAVVRSCTTVNVAGAGAGAAVDDYDDGVYNLESVASLNDDVDPFSYLTLGNVSGGLEDVYKEGCAQPPPITAVETAVRGGGYFDRQLPTLEDSHSFSMESVAIRTRKRKSQQKKMVLQLTQEELSNDMWAWRKYGQKPIKSSPYPRNYYRCSTTKACGARKQVERSPMDPTIFIVSYAGEHMHPRPTHRSSLAGSTRSTKFTTGNNIQPITGDPPAAMPELPPCSSSSPASASSFSPATSLKEDECEMGQYENDEKHPCSK